MSFYIILKSNFCKSTQPSNTSSNFTNDFDSILTLSGAWEVALVEYKLNYFPYLSDPGTCIHYTRKDTLT